MVEYIHELPNWPKFQWDHRGLSKQLAAVRHRQGRLIGRMQELGFPLREEAILQTLTEDVLKSSEIEGEILDKEQVRSSIARRLGMEAAALSSADRSVEGVVEMMLDATQKYQDKLTQDRLFGWHASLFPTGRSGMRKIIVGAWRDERPGPMQIVSGPHGREHIHYEAPPAGRLGAEMRAFLDWFNGVDDTDPVLKAAFAHLWFVTIHPFEDGNGRIARAIADVSRALGRKHAALLQHVRANPARAQCVLRRTGIGAEGRPRHNAVDRMVLGMSRSRLRRRGENPRYCFQESRLLEEAFGSAAERPSA